ncbi:MAG: glycosyltransferase family 4 protein [candidate division Zixibacteria bacterium]|nr:glycosyltransferase family 4 protein [candidate division Zixibacteria bacterium]
MNNKKVLFLSQSFIRFKGDITSHFLFTLAKGILGAGYDLRAVVPHQRGLKTLEKIDGLPVYRFRYMLPSLENLAYTGNMKEIVTRNLFNRMIFLFFLFFYFLKAYKVSKRFNVQIIHTHWWVPSGLIGCLVSYLLKIPLLITTHGTDLRIITDSRLSTFLAKIVFHKASYITVVSNFLKKKLVSELNLPEEKVLVIPMPVNTEKIKVFSTGETKSSKVILCVARYTKQKKLKVLLEALSLLKEWNVDFEVILIGEGPEREELVRRIKALSLEERIKLVGLIPQEELNKYYNLSGVVLLPSVGEGFGLVLVEAGLCKKPVIGTDSGGIPDIIEDGVSGILVPPEDKLALALAIKGILSDEKLAMRLGQNAYEQAWKRFSPEAIIERFLSIYGKLLSENK